MIEAINDIFQTELNKLVQEIKSVPDDVLWKTSREIKNSCRNVCPHLCGNLQHYVEAILGKSGYVRNRDAEFSSRDISKKKLLSEIMKAKEVVAKTLPSLSKNDLQRIYP